MHGTLNLIVRTLVLANAVFGDLLQPNGDAGALADALGPAPGGHGRVVRVHVRHVERAQRRAFVALRRRQAFLLERDDAVGGTVAISGLPQLFLARDTELSADAGFRLSGLDLALLAASLFGLPRLLLAEQLPEFEVDNEAEEEDDDDA